MPDALIPLTLTGQKDLKPESGAHKALLGARMNIALSERFLSLPFFSL